MDGFSSLDRDVDGSMLINVPKAVADMMEASEEINMKMYMFRYGILSKSWRDELNWLKISSQTT